MKVEFIIDKSEYKKLLSKNIFDTQIKYKSEKVKGKSNYLLTLSIESKNFKTAKLLSNSRIVVEKLFIENNIKYRLLTEESALFFVRRLYPYASEFETKLRKFIYTALFDIDEKAETVLVEKYKITISKKCANELPQEDFLTNSDLGKIFDFLFSNDEFLDEARKINNNDNNNKNYDRRLTKKQLLEKIENLEEKTIWNLLFASNFSDSILPTIYNELQKLRNDIMHIHYISYDDYIKAKKIYVKGIKDLDYQLSKNIIIEDTKINVDALASSLGFLMECLRRSQINNSVISDMLKQFTLNYLSSIQALATSLSPLTQQFAQVPTIKMPNQELLSQISKLSNSYNNISNVNPAFIESIHTLTENFNSLYSVKRGDKKDGE